MLGFILLPYIAECIRKSKISIGIEEVDENLPNYFSALDYDDTMYMLSSEKYVRRFHGAKILMDSTLQSLAESSPASRKIQGVAIYDILADIRYCERFQYDYYEQIFKNNFEEESTKVKLWLNLAFMPPNYSKRISNVSQNDFVKNNRISVYNNMIDIEVEKKLNSKSNQILDALEKIDNVPDEENEEYDNNMDPEDGKTREKELKEFLLHQKQQML